MHLPSLAVAVTGLLATALMIPPVSAQDVQVNQRFTAPTAQSDTYAGVAVSQLILALGLTLQGIPAAALHDEAMTHRLPPTDAPSASSRRGPRLLASKPAATVPELLPAAATPPTDAPIAILARPEPAHE